MPSSAALFCFCLQSFPKSRSSPVSQLFASGGQSKHWSLVTPVSKNTEFQETEVGGKNQDTCDYGTVRCTPRILLGSVWGHRVGSLMSAKDRPQQVRLANKIWTEDENVSRGRTKGTDLGRKKGAWMYSKTTSPFSSPHTEHRNCVLFRTFYFVLGHS